MAPSAQDATFAAGHNVTPYIGSIARTDTSAKVLFTLPAGFIPLTIDVSSVAASDAGSTATISVGKSGGTGAELLATYDVKTAAKGKGSNRPDNSGSAAYGASVGTSPYVVTGVYAETGGASTTGGPWVVKIEGIQV